MRTNTTTLKATKMVLQRNKRRNLTKDLADVGVVHVREGLQDLPPLIFGPHHEGIHGPLDMGLTAVPAPGFPEHSSLGDTSTYETWTSSVRWS